MPNYHSQYPLQKQKQQQKNLWQPTAAYHPSLQNIIHFEINFSSLTLPNYQCSISALFSAPLIHTHEPPTATLFANNLVSKFVNKYIILYPISAPLIHRMWAGHHTIGLLMLKHASWCIKNKQHWQIFLKCKNYLK